MKFYCYIPLDYTESILKKNIKCTLIYIFIKVYSIVRQKLLHIRPSYYNMWYNV